VSFQSGELSLGVGKHSMQNLATFVNFLEALLGNVDSIWGEPFPVFD
jgi:hypothetical protein